MSDTLNFAEEAQPRRPGRGTWPLLVVDDEEEVHTVTTLALQEFRFADRELSFVHALSGQQAREILRKRDDIAIILLDVVMETDHAGLDVVEFIRNELNNKFVRIILRTGQPGQAPELEVITRYDINDYKQKTELTRERLYTTVFTALSTYRDLTALEANRRGLRKVIEATAELFNLQSVDRLAQGVLEQLTALLYLDEDVVMLQASGVTTDARMRIIAGTGIYRNFVGQEAAQSLSEVVLGRIQEAQKGGKPVFGEDYFVGCDGRGGACEWMFYVTGTAPLHDPDRELLKAFCRNVAVARKALIAKN